jgi:hypothetical protein
VKNLPVLPVKAANAAVAAAKNTKKDRPAPVPKIVLAAK